MGSTFLSLPCLKAPHLSSFHSCRTRDFKRVDNSAVKFCRQGRLDGGLSVGCVRGEPAMGFKREHEDEMKFEGGEATESDERNDAYEVVELMELEALMGEDEGKEPKDYNRRASIFDKSSKIFMSRKEKEK